MSDNRDDENRSSPPPPPPLPPHPNQAQLIDQEEQPQRIDPPRIKFKNAFIENPQNDDLLNTSPVSRLNLETKQINSKDKYNYLKKKEELIEANYLKKILSKEAINTDHINQIANQNDQAYLNNRDLIESNVPACCHAPPCIHYLNGCKEIKRSINYGRRVHIVDPTPCNHYLIGNNNCENCCKLITLNRNLFSLHCAWHHQLLTCIVCKMTISDLEHRVYKGKIYCEECFKRAKNLHGSELKTIHKK